MAGREEQCPLGGRAGGAGGDAPPRFSFMELLRAADDDGGAAVDAPLSAYLGEAAAVVGPPLPGDADLLPPFCFSYEPGPPPPVQQHLPAAAPPYSDGVAPRGDFLLPRPPPGAPDVEGDGHVEDDDDPSSAAAAAYLYLPPELLGEPSSLRHTEYAPLEEEAEPAGGEADGRGAEDDDYDDDGGAEDEEEEDDDDDDDDYDDGDGGRGEEEEGEEGGGGDDENEDDGGGSTGAAPEYDDEEFLCLSGGEEGEGGEYGEYAATETGEYSYSEKDDGDDDDGDAFADETTLRSMAELKDAAEKDRPPPATSQALREFNADLVDVIRLASGIGKVKRRKSSKEGARRVHMPPEVEAMMQQANSNYTAGEFGEAIANLQEVIRLSPNVKMAWRLLGIIQEELGNEARALQMFMVEAHLDPKTAAWGVLAERSRKQGLVQQAIDCYHRALARNRDDPEAVLCRAELYQDRGDYRTARAGFKRYLQLRPWNVEAFWAIAQSYANVGDFSRAIEQIEIMAEHYYWLEPLEGGKEDVLIDRSPGCGEEGNVFTYREVGLLAELCMKAGDYARAIREIKRGARILQRRRRETWWENVHDDSEYDEARQESRSRTSGVRGSLRGGGTLPIELRSRLGQCRIATGDIAIGKEHFEYLWKHPVEKYPGLHEDAAETLMARHMYRDALEVLGKILACNETDKLLACANTAKCHRELGELENAIQYYEQILGMEGIPEGDVLSTKAALADIHAELGDRQRARELVEAVKQAQAAIKAAGPGRRVSAADPEGVGEQSASGHPAASARDRRSILQAKPTMSKAVSKAQIKRRRMANAARRVAEREAQVRVLFDKWDQASAAIRKARGEPEREIKDQYVLLSRDLMAEFRSERKLFPTAKSEKILSTLAAKLRPPESLGGSIEEQVGNVEARLQGQTVARDPQAEPADVPRTFRGISFERWYDLLTQFAIVAAKDGAFGEAWTALATASEAIVFYRDSQKKIITRLFRIAVGLMQQDMDVVTENCRWFVMSQPREPRSYHLMSMSYASGSDGIAQFGSKSVQMLIQRKVKALDEQLSSEFGLRNAVNSTVDKDNRAGTPENPGAPSADDGGERTPTESDWPLAADAGRDSAEPMDIDRGAASRSSSLVSVEPKLLEDKDDPRLTLFYGNALQIARNYVGAKVFFLRAYASAPDDPLANLCAGLAYLHHAMQRRTGNRHFQIAQSFTFIFRYFELRGGDSERKEPARQRLYAQEAYYNVARAFQQLGLTHLAVPYYEKALALPSMAEVYAEMGLPLPDGWDVEEGGDDPTNLKREAAYNLAMIYVCSGSMGLAQNLLAEYCTI